MSINVSNITTANFHIVLYTLNIEYFTLKISIIGHLNCVQLENFQSLS